MYKVKIQRIKALVYIVLIFFKIITFLSLFNCYLIYIQLKYRANYNKGFFWNTRRFRDTAVGTAPDYKRNVSGSNPVRGNKIIEGIKVTGPVLLMKIKIFYYYEYYIENIIFFVILAS